MWISGGPKGCPEANLQLQQEANDPSTTPGIHRKASAAPPQRVISLWISLLSRSSKKYNLAFPRALLHICEPISGNAAAHDSPPSCPTSNSTHGSGLCPKPRSQIWAKLGRWSLF